MKNTVLGERSSDSAKITRFSIILLFAALVAVGCGKAPLGASGAEVPSAMEAAPADIVTDNCEEQGPFASDCNDFMADGAGKATNVILLIGDGMGQNQVFAARVLVNGPHQPLKWELLENQGTATTCAISSITDSAAGATAISTGNKTQKGAIGMIIEPEQKKLTNIVDLNLNKKAVGLVTTTKVWDATPAAFAAHAPSRYMDAEISHEMITVTKPEVILGGGRKAFTGKKSRRTNPEEMDLVEIAKKEGYRYITTSQELAGLDDNTEKVLGLFAGGSMEFEVKRKTDTTEPHLTEMASAALKILDRDERGFFLLIEGALIDHAGHMLSENKMSGELIEFNQTVEMVLDWAKDRPDTLVLIAADHETGTTRIVPGEYKKGDMLKFKWKMTAPMYAYHSGQRIRVFGLGPNSAAIQDHMDNTGLFCIMKNAFGN